jgi:hypothetical protein
VTHAPATVGRCPLSCDAVVEDHDELADHLEAHDAVDWLMQSRPVGFKEMGSQ